MDKIQIIENISKKGKVPVAELEKEYNEIFNTLPPSDDREKQALKQLNNNHVSIGEDRTEDVEMIVIGLRQQTDFNRKKIEDILKKFESDKEEMLNSGKVKMVDVKVGESEEPKVRPAVIDMQEEFQVGQDMVKNPSFGKELGPSYNRNTLIFARMPGDKEWVISNFALRNDFATEFKKENMFIPMTVNCLGTIADGLKTGKSTKYIPFDEDINVSNLIATLCGDHIQSLGDAMAYAEKQDSKDYDRFIVTSGTVQFVNEPKKEGQSYRLAIDDMTTDHLETAWVDEIIGIPEQKKDYTLICQTAIGDKKDKEGNKTGEKQLTLNVLGWYP